MRKMIVVLLLTCASALFAQVQANTPVKKAGTVSNIQMRAQVAPEVTLQRQIDAMKIQIKELKKQLDMVAQQTASIKNSFPRCSADLQTSSSSLGSRGCAPYACDVVVGTCMTQCATSDMCAQGYLCDVGAGQCVPAPR